MARILYIAGYGRSGSTVLSTVLGSHPDIVSVGEIGFAVDDWTSGYRTCSCGRMYRDCEFWSDLVADPVLGPDAGASIRRTDRLSSYLRLWLGLVGRTEREIYRIAHERILGHILNRTGKSIVVDSSKSARLTVGRALALRRLGGHDVYVLHLVRDGRATVTSLVRVGSNWTLEEHRAGRKFPALWGALNWVWTNLCASALRLSVPRDRFLFLRYEDFVADPDGSLSRIGTLLDLDMETLTGRVREGAAFPVGHTVGGNRVRFQGEIAIDRHQGYVRTPRLDWHHELLFQIVGGWLNRWYGYGK